MAKNDTTPYGLGRRKTAVAQVLLTAAADTRTVNGHAFDVYFPTISMQETALKPLKAASQDDVFGIKAKVHGGGKQAQAQAITLAIARALISVDPDHRKQLKKAGLLTRDPRMKERKKPGLRGARRAPQFSKR